MVGIKDFGMPSCCGNCEMSSCKGWGNFYCDITLEEIDMDSDKRDADCPLVEAIPKDQYEARLKADMIAMLEDLKSGIEEEKQDTKHLHYDELENAESYNNGIDNCIDSIQQKIDELRE